MTNFHVLCLQAKENSQTMWVQKNNNHRGIKIKQIGGKIFDMSETKKGLEHHTKYCIQVHTGQDT
jgi:hypothetical protein